MCLEGHEPVCVCVWPVSVPECEPVWECGSRSVGCILLQLIVNASIFVQPADHECPPGPGSIQAPQLPEGEACRESPHALYIKGAWDSPSRGAILEGPVDASKWGSWGTVYAVPTPPMDVCMFCSNPGPQKCLMFLLQSWQQSLCRPRKAFHP